MSDFQDAIGTVLQNEGGFVDNKSDPGGRTNMGITQHFVNGLAQQGKIQAFDVANMTVDQATSLYQTYWWNAYQYGNINDQTVATKVFDFSVNMGPHRAHVLMQEACNNVASSGLTCDGALGPASFAAINAITDTQSLITAYSDAAWAFYQGLANANAALAQFLNGWKNRAYSISTAGQISSS